MNPLLSTSHILVLVNPPLPQTDMETAHLYQKKATGVTVPAHVLDFGQKIGARNSAVNML
jgi:hypothetical protein